MRSPILSGTLLFAAAGYLLGNEPSLTHIHPAGIQQGTEADFVIFDTPPINRVGDALTIAGLVEGSILVVGSGLCDQHEVAWAKHLLANVQANLVGVILNLHARRHSGDSYYYYQAGHEPRMRVKARV